MNNLLNFFVKHSAWFIFAIYVILSLVLLFKDNPYQQSVYLTSANSVSAAVYKAFSNVTSYFHLRDINESLQERNAALEMELIELRKQMSELELLSPDSLHQPVLKQYSFVMAQVISNSIAQPNNYITINRGYMDGIQPEMGVIDQNGVVGIVNVEYAVLEELPKHVKYHTGDTIVTSGYSAVFPPGIIVGTIQGIARGTTDSFVSLRIKLTTNFSQLSSVRVITNSMKEQIDALRRAEQGIDTAANIETRPEIKPEIIDVVPDQEKPKKADSKHDQPAQPNQVQSPQPVQAVEPDNNQGGEEQP